MFPRAFLPICLVSVLLFSACAKKAEPLPVGSQTMTGVLKPIEFSLVRRGTHILLQDGKPTYYVESQTVNLFDHEGMPVTLKGTLQENTDPTLPAVLVVTDLEDKNREKKQWTVVGLGLTLEVPDSWHASIEADKAAFFQDGSKIPVLTLFRQKVSALSFDWQNVPFSIDKHITLFPVPVLGRRAIDTVNDTGDLEAILIGEPGDKDVVTFQFSLHALEPMPDVETLIREIVESIAPVKNTISASTETGSAQTGSGSFTACGGPVGVLCPSGFYCSITDKVDNVGRCVKL